jgi:hypothetical protein
MITQLKKPLAVFSLMISIALVLSYLPQQADAKKGNRGGGGKARTSVNRNKNVNVNRNKNTNRNRNVNVNRNKNVNVDVNVNRRGGRRHGYRPVATGVAIAATAIIVGSVVRSLPTGCSTVVRHGIAYSQCGTVWYEPQYAGNDVTYVIVNTP